LIIIFDLIIELFSQFIAAQSRSEWKMEESLRQILRRHTIFLGILPTGAGSTNTTPGVLAQQAASIYRSTLVK
jgi:hypothetical protein